MLHEVESPDMARASYKRGGAWHPEQACMTSPLGTAAYIPILMTSDIGRHENAA